MSTTHTTEKAMHAGDITSDVLWCVLVTFETFFSKSIIVLIFLTELFQRPRTHITEKIMCASDVTSGTMLTNSTQEAGSKIALASPNSLL